MNTEPRIVTTVCTGNLCRSPMAEVLLRKHLDRLGVTDVVVQSAGIRAKEGQKAIGASHRAVEALGADLSSHVTSLLDRVTLDESHLVLCATQRHVDKIRERWPDFDFSKVRLFNESILEEGDEDMDVEDPSGFDDALFLLIGRVIDGAMEAWAESLVRSPWKD